MDPIKLPIQLDAPIRVYDPSGNEYTIAEAYMLDGYLCLDITPNEGVSPDLEERDPATMSDVELYGAGS